MFNVFAKTLVEAEASFSTGTTRAAHCWEKIMEFKQETGAFEINYMLVTKKVPGSQKAVGLTMSRSSLVKRIKKPSVFLRHWDIHLLKQALWAEDGIPLGEQVLLDDSVRKVSIIREEEALTIKHWINGRTTVLKVLDCEFHGFKSRINAVNVLFSIRRSATAPETDKQAYYKDSLAQIMRFFIHKIVKCTAYTPDCSFNAATVPEGNSALVKVHGVEVSKSYYDASQFVLKNMNDITVMYESVLRALLFPSPPALTNEELMDAIYKRGYELYTGDEGEKKSAIPYSVIVLLVENYP
ncbi:hypothetical protein HDE_09030 [Halotydeus destructor]|nr:hypothetical protein HDE_09030 [Halotydeus destructor]